MAIESQGTTLSIASGAGGAETITAMTLSYPTVLTSVAHALVEGDVVTLANFAGDDAATLNAQEAVVQYVTTDTFAVAIDTTGKTITDNTDAATATPKAWQAVGEITDWSGPGGTAAVIDTTHLTSTRKEKLMGIPDEGQISFNMNFVVADVGQVAVAAARAARLEKSFKVTYSDGSTATFDGYVLGFASSGGVDGKVSGSITIEITGEVTYTP